MQLFLSLLCIILLPYAIYGAAQENDECEVALFTITGMATDSGHTPMRGLLFCSTAHAADDPRALIDRIRTVTYGNERPYQWLVDIRKELAARVKVEFLHESQHIRIRMGESAEKIINPLGTIDPLTVGVVLGGHNPFKSARIPLDYRQWLKRYTDDRMSVSSGMRTPLLPCIVRNLNIRTFSESNHPADSSYGVDRARLHVCTRAEQSIEAIYSVLNIPAQSAVAIIELLKKSMILNSAYIGMRVKLQLKDAAAPIVFDVYRKSGKIRTAYQSKPNNRIIKSTTEVV